MTHTKKYRRMESSMDLDSIEATINDLQLQFYMIVHCDEVYYLFWDRIY